MIKFLCKDMWTLVFRKQIDNLKTNHRVRTLKTMFLSLFYLEKQWLMTWSIIGGLRPHGQCIQAARTHEYGVACGGGCEGAAGMLGFSPGCILMKKD